MAIDERLVFLEGKHVRLVALSTADVSDSPWVGWFNNEATCRYNQHHYFPNTFERQLNVLSGIQTENKLQLGIVDRASPAAICGVVSLGAIDWIHRHADIGGIQDPATAQNPGLFFEAWSLMLRHGFEQLGLHKIYGGTFHPHVAAALVRIFNFEIEGVRHRHVFKSGTYWDVTLVGVFADTVRYPEF